MLETRMPPASARMRRAHGSARPQERPNAAPAAEPFRRSLPSVRQSRLSRAEMRLMGLATVCTASLCALLLLYLAAYAQVTQLGIAQAQARAELRRNQIRNQLLLAQCQALESPQRVVTAAQRLGMTQRGSVPVSYIHFVSDWDYGSKGATTEDSRAAASLHH